jgi:hypothetical protein
VAVAMRLNIRVESFTSDRFVAASAVMAANYESTGAVRDSKYCVFIVNPARLKGANCRVSCGQGGAYHVKLRANM